MSAPVVEGGRPSSGSALRRVRAAASTYTDPRGAAPEREPGEPPFASLVAVVTGAVLALVGLLELLRSPTQGSTTARGVLVLVVAVAIAVLGELLARRVRRPVPVARGLADFLQALAAVLVGVGVGVLADDAGTSDKITTLLATLAGLAAAVAAYAWRRRGWQVLVLVTAAAGVLLSIVSQTDTTSLTTYGVLLLLLALVGYALVAVRVLRPVGPALIAGSAIAFAGCQVLLRADTGVPGGLVVLVVPALAVVAVLTRRMSIVPVLLIVGAVLLPQGLHPLTDYVGYGVDAVIVGGVTALVIADLERRSPLRVRAGGLFALTTLITVAGAGYVGGVALQATTVLGLGGADDELDRLLAVLGLVALLVAAVATHRRPAAVLAAVALAADGPPALLGGHVTSTATLGAVSLALGVVVVIGALLVRPGHRPPGAAITVGELPAGPTGSVALAAPYEPVFAAVVGLLGGAGRLDLLDRAAGRVVVGEVSAAVWQSGPDRTTVAFVGPEPVVEGLLTRVVSGPEAGSVQPPPRSPFAPPPPVSG